MGTWLNRSRKNPLEDSKNNASISIMDTTQLCQQLIVNFQKCSMSNNLVSQPLTISDGQGATGNPAMSNPSVHHNLRRSLRNSNGNPLPQQLPTPSSDGQLDPVSNRLVLHEMQSSNEHLRQVEPMIQSGNMQQFSMRSGHVGQMQGVQTDSGQQRLFTNKRKASSEINPVMLKMSTSDKKSMQVGHSPTSGVLQLSGPNKNSSVIADSSKKVTPIETVMRKSQPSASKSRPSPPVPSPKGKTEISDSVRSKLRESLASALALVSQEQQDSSNAEESSQKEIAKTSMEWGDLKPPESTSSITDADPTKSEESADASASGVLCQTDGCNDPKIAPQGTVSKDANEETRQTWKFVGQDFLSHPVDASFTDTFFAKDDLLLGNGLTWAFDLDNMEVAGLKEAEPTPKLSFEDAGGVGKEQTVSSPELVAFMIESELFKLFGDVNKKYKEKGRSLVFNLKDRNNPELRARVMSGAISPERLCSMTAEELASKELSQWRSAKAEQLAQMKILPDSDANMRRLVKKTHKGEYQVEVEHDIVAPVETPVNASLPPANQSKSDETEAKPTSEAKIPSKADKTRSKVNVAEERRNMEDQDNQDRITIPSDGTDLMQGLMVVDMKDLPPILSLDEFMDSLDREPPFANLPVDSENTAHLSEKESSETGSGLKSSEQASKDAAVAPLTKSELANAESKKTDAGSTKPDDESKKSDVISERLSRASDIQKGDCVWEGSLQLSISSTADVIGFYKSGEKAITKDWPNQFEIKGRVRLDPFEKFIHDLPMSRSRAIMVAHFVPKDGSNDEQRTSLFEVVDSYIQDQRVGFAEPTPGFEVYFCPPHTGTLEMLRKHLSKDYTESVKAIETGLIGIVVWRKPHLTQHTVSPKSSSQNAKRQEHNTYRRPQEKDMNMNVNFAARPDPVPTFAKSVPVEDDDDVPPGFGPPAPRDEDDLPEFKFTGGSSPSVPHLAHQNVPLGRPSPAPTNKVEHMRELVQKYGQNRPNVFGSGIAMQPWNDDEDDDDIPEWQPQAPQQQLPPPPLTPRPGLQLPVMPLHAANQPHLQPPLTPLGMPMQQLQPPMKMQNQAWWPHGAPPPPVPPNNMGPQLIGRHHYMTSGTVTNLPGREWRSGGPRSRGF